MNRCFLPTVSLFAPCSRDTLFGLATSVKKRTFPANLAIVTEGSRANECYLIRTGKATAKIRVKYRLSPGTLIYHLWCSMLHHHVMMMMMTSDS
jgi:hypothetical protein